MSKKEVYYKFIFPNYNKLTGIGDSRFGTDEHPVRPTSDGGNDQTGEVLSLCRACPERVITYDQLSAETPTVPMYLEAWPSSRDNERAAIKQYLDDYLAIPKYFDLRNYWDADITQAGGMSLMVFHSPEIGLTSTSWTKFSSTYNGVTKTVYCSLMISSGDFFYGFNLPDDVLSKSGLRDSIVDSRFHSNWYLTDTETVTYHKQYSSVTGDRLNPVTGNSSDNYGREKLVFNKANFFDREVVPVGKKWVDLYDAVTGNIGKDSVNDTITDLHTNTTDPVYTDPTNIEYNPAYGDQTVVNIYDGDVIVGTTTKGALKIQEDANSDNTTLSFQNQFASSYPVGSKVRLNYGIYGGKNKNTGRATTHTYSDIREDLKKDFIDLEVTRRILHYGEYDFSTTQLKNYKDPLDSSTTIYNEIPITSGSGKDTVLSFEPPQEYIDRPPLQIPYNLLRYSLNDRAPFGDCETVLVMWVANNTSTPANGDPDNVADGDVAALHDLDWQQYAIPLSVRCCFKDVSSSNMYCNKRFLVSYPYLNKLSNVTPNMTYRFHLRRTTAYNNDASDDVKFKEVLYLQDLIDYSSNYVIVLQVKDCIKGFDIQHYLLENYAAAFKKLYVRKTYKSHFVVDEETGQRVNTVLSNNQQNQFYYVRVNQRDSQNNNVFLINTNGYDNNNPRICICEPVANSVTALDPRTIITRTQTSSDPDMFNGEVTIIDQHRNWDFDDVTYYQKYGFNDFYIDDKSFIALFDASYKVGGNNIFKRLENCIITLAHSYNGVSLKQFLYDANHDQGDWSDLYISSLGISPKDVVNAESLFYTGNGVIHFSLGLLDNYLILNDVQYGSSTNGKVIVGFDRLFDYKYEGAYHFRYNEESGGYDPVKTVYDCTNKTISYLPLSANESYVGTAYYVENVHV